MIKEIKILADHGIQYIPDLKNQPVDERFRGRPVISNAITSEQVNEAFSLCPASAIDRHTGALDMGRCTFCNECALAMPETYRFTNDYRIAATRRENLIINPGQKEQQNIDQERKKVILRRDKWLNELDEYFTHSDYIISKETILRKISEQEEKLKTLDTLTSETQWKIDAKTSEKQNMRHLRKIIPNWYDNFTNKPVEVQNDMLKYILDKVVYFRDHLDIHFKIDIETLSKGQNQSNQYLTIYKVASI